MHVNFKVGKKERQSRKYLQVQNLNRDCPI